MHKIVFTDYYTGKKVKSLTVNTSSSISFSPEPQPDGSLRLVVRDYYSGKKLRTCAMPARSCHYHAVSFD